jgi:hypothetical protein
MARDWPVAVERIIREKLGGEALAVEAVAGGHSGAGVWRVWARLAGGERELVVKTAAVEEAEEGSDEGRVYGTHPASLGAVHALLRARGLPTYELLGWGMPSTGVPAFWAAMSRLGGVSVRGHRGEPDAESFQRACGEALGAVHAVARAYDGAIDLAGPHATAWHEAFFAAFEGMVEREVVGRGLGELAGAVRAFVERARREWVTPERYALSHVDGLQGHAEHGGDGWRFLGHVDLEDYVFLDARFALAGYELGAGGRAPAAFWEGYRALAAVDGSYEAARGVMQAFFLVNWLWLEGGRAGVVERIRRVVGGD